MNSTAAREPAPTAGRLDGSTGADSNSSAPNQAISNAASDSRSSATPTDPKNLFGQAALESTATQVAQECRSIGYFRGRNVVRQVTANLRLIEDSYRRHLQAHRAELPIDHGGQWLLESYSTILETYADIRNHLSAGYYRELPKLTEGEHKGLPRVHRIAESLLAMTDCSLDMEVLTSFVQKFQQTSPLSTGEIWAIPIMLRVVLIDRIGPLATRMAATLDDQAAAVKLLQQLEDAPPSEGIPASRDEGSRWSAAFVLQLREGLQSHPHHSAMLANLETLLADSHSGLGALADGEQRRRAADLVHFSNAVTTLRLLTAVDWKEFFEQVSLVEALLNEDPAGVFPIQDFNTKDRCRHAVEEIAKGCKLDEVEVVEQVLLLTKEGAGADSTGRALGDHVDYYLLGRGRRRLEKLVGFRPNYRERLSRALETTRSETYLFSILTLTILLSAGFYALFTGLVEMSVTASIVLVLLTLLPASELAGGIVNYIIIGLLPPRSLSRLDFKGPMPVGCETFVVVPCMFTRPEGVKTLLERIESHYLSNPDPRLWFALLSDFADADEPELAKDEGLIEQARRGIEALNERHASREKPIFFFFHRRRLWNRSQKRWMGWERKRGKLMEFNRLLLGATNTSFMAASCNWDAIPKPNYVITLDADTQFPHDSAKRLVGTAHHPLNRPRLDPKTRRVVEGYTILQPRVSFSLTGARKTLFARIFSGSAGIDPYAMAISDVYQDLFEAGSFAGKGIYHLESFEAALDHRFPEDWILSHDLIEGNFARCGLVTEIELLDEFPSRYLVFSKREHRWIRGDWQILSWLFPWVPVDPKFVESKSDAAATAGEGTETAAAPLRRVKYVRNSLPVIERWKIFDNLRRSLVAPGLLALLLFGWLATPQADWRITLIVLLALALPVWLQLFGMLRSLLFERKGFESMRALPHNLASTLGQLAFDAIVLPHKAVVAVDAVVRTLYRLAFTHRNMLEWETAAASEMRLSNDARSHLISMIACPIAGVGSLVAVLASGASVGDVFGVLPWSIGWFISPWIASLLSQPAEKETVELQQEQITAFRRTARKTWSFFEEFVTESDNWIPPDNMQEGPVDEVAHRTSTTNMGLYLLSSVCAHDLGFISLTNLTDRIDQSLATLEKLQRYRGHILNWYDTQSLRPLEPMYVSTVDSGNLLGCLIALKHSLLEKLDEPMPGPEMAKGIRDTLAFLDESASSLQRSRAEISAERAHKGRSPASSEEKTDRFRTTQRLVSELSDRLKEIPSEPMLLLRWLEEFHRAAGALFCRVEIWDKEGFGEFSEVTRWSRKLNELTSDLLEDWSERAGWHALLDERVEMVAHFAEEDEELSNWLDELYEPVSVRSWEEKLRGTAARIVSTGLPEGKMVELATAVESSSNGRLHQRVIEMIRRLDHLITGMDFAFLYGDNADLFAIGYNVTTGRMDSAHYDLLASEASLASFLAVSRGEAPKKHWFQLNRPLLFVNGEYTLRSWGGTMFEYMLPRMFLKTFPGSLLTECQKSCVRAQIAYGRLHSVPWGISESAYSATDAEGHYHYQAFGVPWLGLKGDIVNHLVIAPYASALAAGIAPFEVADNFAALRREGAEGRFGFYDAVDYTASRVPPGQRCVVVRNYMAHHQGMTMIGLTNALMGDHFARRMHHEPSVRATQLLLEERFPIGAPTVPERDETTEAETSSDSQVEATIKSRRIATPYSAFPRTHLIANGRASVMVTNAGGGYFAHRGERLTHWKPDRTRDAQGTYILVRSQETHQVWSSTYQPVRKPADTYEVTFAADRAEFKRRDGAIETRTEITVSPDVDAELRRVAIENHGTEPATLEVTSLVDCVWPLPSETGMPPLVPDIDWLPSRSALLLRLPSTGGEESAPQRWLVHVLAVDCPLEGPLRPCTERFSFQGAAGTLALGDDDCDEEDSFAAEVASDGPVLSLAALVKVPPGGTVHLTFTTAVADSRSEAEHLADHFRHVLGVTRAFELAWAHLQQEIRQHTLGGELLQLYQRMTAHLLYGGFAFPRFQDSLPAAPAIDSGAVATTAPPLRELLTQRGMKFDRPLIAAWITDASQRSLVEELARGHQFWRRRGLAINLVFWCERATGGAKAMAQSIDQWASVLVPRTQIGVDGGLWIFAAEESGVRDAEAAADLSNAAASDSQVAADSGSTAERVQVLPGIAGTDWESVATCWFHGEEGELADQVLHRERMLLPANLAGAAVDQWESHSEREWSPIYSTQTPSHRPVFNSETQEWHRLLRGLPHTPSQGMSPSPSAGAFGSPQNTTDMGADVSFGEPPPGDYPRRHVIANPHLAFSVDDRGTTSTWCAGNSQERLTTPTEGSLVEQGGEWLYLRDEQTGEFWSPLVASDTKMPPREGQSLTTFGSHGGSEYRVRHGLGCAVFENRTAELESEVTLFVPREEPIKVVWTRIRNHGSSTRRLSLTYVADLSLGDGKNEAVHLVRVVHDGETETLTATAENNTWRGRRVFVAATPSASSFTGDRSEFLGRNGGYDRPLAMYQPELSRTTPLGSDPCAAQRVTLELAPGEEQNVVFILGVVTHREEIIDYVNRYRRVEQCRRELLAVRSFWQGLGDSLSVRTPWSDLNRWVGAWGWYHLLSEQLWGRTGLAATGTISGFCRSVNLLANLQWATPASVRSALLPTIRTLYREQRLIAQLVPVGSETPMAEPLPSHEELALLTASLDYLRHTGDESFTAEPLVFGSTEEGLLVDWLRLRIGRVLDEQEQGGLQAAAQERDGESPTRYQAWRHYWVNRLLTTLQRWRAVDQPPATIQLLWERAKALPVDSQGAAWELDPSCQLLRAAGDTAASPNGTATESTDICPVDELLRLAEQSLRRGEVAEAWHHLVARLRGEERPPSSQEMALVLRFVRERLLGLNRQGMHLWIDPHLPASSSPWTVHLAPSGLDYTLELDGVAGKSSDKIECDGEPLEGDGISLQADGRPHRVVLR